MSEIQGIGAYNYASTTASTSGTSSTTGMSVSDFYKLLAAQMRYQDADNPMNTSEMMSQMVQTQMIEAITNMSTINTITYASSMIGKEVTMAEVDSSGKFTGAKTSGTVTGILMGENPILFMGDKSYYMAQIMTVGKVPEAGESGDNGSGEAENGGNTGTD